MKRIRRAAVITSLVLVAAWAQEPTPKQKAVAAINDLSMILKQLLGEELKRGGFEGAVKACSESAQLVTEEFSRERELSIRRVSLKYRNPKDQPDEWETAKLRQWEKLHAEGRLPQDLEEIVTENGRRFLRYMKPITVDAMCLSCHGSSQISPEVKEVLDARYPRDKATGYKSRDLRGAFSVMVALPK